MLFAVESAAALESIAGGLGIYYLILASMNAVCALYLWRNKDEPGPALIWTTVAVVFVILAPLAMSGNPAWVPQMPDFVVWLSGLLSGKTGAIVYSVGTTVAMVTMFIFRRFFVRPMVAWTM